MRRKSRNPVRSTGSQEAWDTMTCAWRVHVSGVRKMSGMWNGIKKGEMQV
jgi:hypothetical protein